MKTLEATDERDVAAKQQSFVTKPLRVLIACEFSGTVREAFRARGHDAWSCDLLPTEQPGPHYQGDVRDILDGWQTVMFAAECDPEGDGWCQVRDCDPSSCPCLGPTQDGVEYKEVNGVLLGRHEDHPHWDLMIAHPDCKYLANSAEWAYKDPDFERYPGVGYHQRLKPATLFGEARRAARQEAIDFFLKLWTAPIPQIVIENPVGAVSKMLKPTQTIQPWMFGDDASKATCLWLKGLPALKATNEIPPRMVGDRPRWANQCDNGQNKLPPSDDRWKLRAKTYQGIADAMAERWG